MAAGAAGRLEEANFGSEAIGGNEVRAAVLPGRRGVSHTLHRVQGFQGQEGLADQLHDRADREGGKQRGQGIVSLL